MRFRIDPDESRPADGARDEPTASRARRHARDFAFVIGFTAVAWAIVRHLGSRSDEFSSSESIRDRHDRATSEREAIPIGEPRAAPDTGASETGSDEGAGSESDGPIARDDAIDEATDEPVDDAETTVGLTDEERSPEEIEERSEPDVQEEPAEPGEMAVDEDIAEELVDGDSSEGAGSEPSGDSTDESEDEAGGET